MMIRSNIPLSKVDFPAFRDIFSKFCGRKLNSSSHYRKDILPRLAKQCDKQILNVFKNPFYIMIDESPDRIGRKILNILVGKLSKLGPEKSYVYECIECENTRSDFLLH